MTATYICSLALLATVSITGVVMQKSFNHRQAMIGGWMEFGGEVLFWVVCAVWLFDIASRLF